MASRAKDPRPAHMRRAPGAACARMRTGPLLEGRWTAYRIVVAGCIEDAPRVTRSASQAAHELEEYRISARHSSVNQR